MHRYDNPPRNTAVQSFSGKKEEPHLHGHRSGSGESEPNFRRGSLGNDRRFAVRIRDLIWQISFSYHSSRGAAVNGKEQALWLENLEG